MARVLFVQDSGINESLALTELSSALSAAGHETRLLLGDEERQLRRRIRAFSPELCIIPCPVAGHERALLDARRVRQSAPDCPIVLGGTHATFHPELIERAEVDVVCIGEAELPLVELARRVDSGEGWRDIPGLVLQVDGDVVQNPLGSPVGDLDDLPLPDRALYFRYPFLARLPWKKFSTGRGCVHDCAFCWNQTLNRMLPDDARFVRRKSPARAVAEVRDVQDRWPLRLVHFSDDLFTVHPEWVEEFAERYPAVVGLPFTCNTSVPLVTERAVQALRRAGCAGVAIGVETGSEDLRMRILGKAVPNDDIREAARRIKGAGMQLITYNMVGSPGETVEDVLETIRLNREIGTDLLRVNIAIPLPNTAFEDTAFSLGFLEERAQDNLVQTLTRPEVLVQSAERQALVNLYLLFRAGVHMGLPASMLRRMAGWGDLRTLQLLRLWGIYEEKRLTRLRWHEGLRFFAHVGDPRRRTANYVTLV